MHFLEKLAEIESKYDELTAQLGDPAVLADQALYQKTAKAHSELSEIVEKYREWKSIRKSLEETKAMLEEASTDAEMKALAHEELAHLEKRQAKVEEELGILLLPRDPNNEKNVVLESAPARAGMRRRSLRRKSSVCMTATLNHRAGGWKCSRRAFQASVA